MSAAERAREWVADTDRLTGKVSGRMMDVGLVRDLLAELDQAQLGRDMWGRTADTLGGNLEDVGHILSGVRYDEAEDVYRAANRVVAERDAALATLAEVREVADNDDLDVLPKLVRILIALDRGPR